VEICFRYSEHRLNRRKVAIVEIKGENLAQVIPDAGDSLIAELPATVVEELTDPRQLQSIEEIGCSNTESDMRRNREARREVVEDIGRYRIGMPIAADSGDREVASDQTASFVLAGSHLERAARTKLISTEKFERMLALLFKLQEMRRSANPI
jgi:hypothetical protein